MQKLTNDRVIAQQEADVVENNATIVTIVEFDVDVLFIDVRIR